MFRNIPKRLTREAKVVSESQSGASYPQADTELNFRRRGDHEPSRFSSISRHCVSKPRVPKDGAPVFTRYDAGSLAHFPTNHACRSIENIWDDARMGARGTRWRNSFSTDAHQYVQL